MDRTTPSSVRGRSWLHHEWNPESSDFALEVIQAKTPDSRLRGDDGREGTAAPQSADVMRIVDIGFDACAALLAQHGLQLIRVEDGASIPGSYWGECEAGVIESRVYARADTPLHSLLHEACHLLVLDPARRAVVHTDASDSQIEEDATCYLQIILAESLPGFGRERALTDMDAWGYTFRLGSARAWFESDSEDACAFLIERGLLPVAP